jgi:hypothetical protein
MTNFVPVHGSCQGGWIWQHVATRLRAVGADHGRLCRPKAVLPSSAGIDREAAGPTFNLRQSVSRQGPSGNKRTTFALRIKSWLRVLPSRQSIPFLSAL